MQDTLPDDNLLLRLKKENARLKAQVRSLFYLVAIYKELVALSALKSNQVLAVRKSMERLLCHGNESGSINLIWRYLPFSFKQWKVWSGQRHCLNSLQGLCRRQNLQQLSVSEQETIREGCANKEYENWPLSSIYYQLLREKKINCCQSTFYKYCRLLGITRKRIKRPKKYTESITPGHNPAPDHERGKTLHLCDP